MQWVCTHLSHRFAKGADVLDQQTAAAFEQIDGEKIRPSWDAIAAVIWHG
jgi:hypothetical protein